VLGPPRHHEDVAGAQADGALPAVFAQRHVERAVEHEEELIGVLVHVPYVFSARVRDPDVVVVDPADDPRAVDVAESGQGLGQVDWSVRHTASIAYAAAACLV
jgi:hypothetical protein